MLAIRALIDDTPKLKHYIAELKKMIPNVEYVITKVMFSTSKHLEIVDNLHYLTNLAKNYVVGKEYRNLRLLGIDYAPLKTSLAQLDLKDKDCKIHPFDCINDPSVDGFGALLHEIDVDPKNQIGAFVFGDPQPGIHDQSLDVLNLNNDKDCKIHPFDCINDSSVDSYGALLHKIDADPKNQIDALVFGDPQPGIHDQSPDVLNLNNRQEDTNTMMQKKKHLSSIANDVVLTCARTLDTSVDSLVEEFEAEWKPEIGGYSRKFVEYCSTKALIDMCRNIEEKMSDGSFSRVTFDMMVAWEMLSCEYEEAHTECVGKEKEDGRRPLKVSSEQDEVSLFYTDLMPLLADHKHSVGEDAFVWLAMLVPLVADVVNGRFTFETLTAPTGNRLHFPAYDIFLKEIDKCIKHLQNQATPKGVELADDEYILHVEGTASSQRVVRHIGKTSWPGRLTLTNYALYFEASGAVTYEDAIKIDLSKDIEHSFKPTATGPWGAPLFDKAIVYESPELSEGIVLEFPELTSSTRRGHWLALTKEIMLMHQFLLKYEVECPIQAWEMHARTILSIIRLHAAREMLRISPPDPMKFLIFALFDELPKGDYVLSELADSLKKVKPGHSCSGSSILRSMNLSQSIFSGVETKEAVGDKLNPMADSPTSLETAINQTREEAKEIDIAKSTTEGLKDEGIGDSALVFMELLKPLKGVVPWFQEIISWKKPITTIAVIAATLQIVYNEWVGKAIAACLLWGVLRMLRARRERLQDKYNEIVISTASDKTTMENLVSAQYGLITVHEILQAINIAILKLWSILVSKARKHADITMLAMSAAAILLAMIPFKFIIMAGVFYVFIMNSKIGKLMENDQGNRRLKEWWDSIPIIPVQMVDQVQVPDTTPK
ncbi:hypothetical protein Q3G72_008439 [Acer saccharum]|nr:hypothetical protein Q3G72_008439 [Acer saccharum]